MTSHPQKSSLGYILKGYPRISETFISNEILLLEKLGFTMRLFPMRLPRESFSHASVKEIKARVDYLPTELFADFFRLLRPNIFLAAKRPQTFRKTIVAASRGISKGKELATLKHLLQAGYLTNEHLEKDPGVAQLHGHFAHSPTSVTMFASLLSGIPFSFTAHAKDIYTSDREKLRKKITQARFVVTCTRHNAEYLRTIAGDCPTPIYCIYHGIDLNLFQQAIAESTTHAPYSILTVARMTQKKGLPTIYRALAELQKKGIAFQHTLIGDGDDREKILGLISSLGLEENCRWLGTQTHDEVLRHFKNSDLFVLGCEIAKNGDRDGIPNVLVESLAMGVPALSTTVSAIPEILIDGKTGITVPPSQPGQLATAMLRILTDQQLRHRLITGGQELVKDQFDNSRWIQELAGIFRRHNVHFQ
ncbi:glycosyltransferase family 4 protein [Desulfopila sp. IMCC35006]|uniref:glycosyltransferase family 4 protein n=1 Tax=Desulfopila sp. IMCC35006 TaxID=2569542 RepID=UPI0010ABAFF4|nr:glycosyltransferase family 4 protein [Desulfopila sp. IMCC35006]TKB23827.1 glycosyltransferase family 4 protein [Desulfopila sp. IMCC35006]